MEHIDTAEGELHKGSSRKILFQNSAPGDTSDRMGDRHRCIYQTATNYDHVQ
jgi:hypothetical protein